MRTLNTTETENVAGSGAGFLAPVLMLDAFVVGTIYTYYQKKYNPQEQLCPYHPQPQQDLAKVLEANGTAVSPAVIAGHFENVTLTH